MVMVIIIKIGGLLFKVCTIPKPQKGGALRLAAVRPFLETK